MTQEEKQLLLKDLCARLPYGVKLGFKNSDLILAPKEFNIYTMQLSTVQIYPESDSMVIGHVYDVWNYRPYLRPMSSMTVEEKKELKSATCPEGTGYFDEQYLICPMSHFGEYISYDFMSDILNWLNAHHFDYRGLIPIGLALEALEGMYKTE